jgi:predicted metalloendopeptidase
MPKRALLLLLASISVGGAIAGTAAAAKPAKAGFGIDFQGGDPAVKPGDDFYGYANGRWLKTAKIPADRSSWGPGPVLQEATTKRLLGLVQAAEGTKAAPGSDARLVADFYKAFMDQAGIESRGLAPMQARLGRISAISDRKALSEALGRTLRTDVDPLYATNFQTSRILGLWVAQDLNNPDHNAPYLLQGGLGLPDREYYLDASPRMAEIRAKYLKHLEAMFTLAGQADPAGKAAAVMDLETKIARAHATREASEHVENVKTWARADFDAKAPGMDWAAYFGASGLANQQEFILWHPDAVTGEAALVASESLDAWKALLMAHELDQFAPELPKAFDDEAFAFYGTVLNGVPKQRDRWKRAITAEDAALGDALGRMYVKRYFPPAAKAKIEAVTANVKAAFGRRIDALTWMAPATKAQAKAKLATLYVGVGYPPHGARYDGLKISPSDALSNADEWEVGKYRRDLAKLTSPVDRQEWWMTAPTINAVNLPIQNALNFPAAILQSPYFDAAFDPAVNYAAIGATIGHEISHSFDDEGAQFDSTGKLHNWWTDQDLAHFKAASEQLAAQYDTYAPFPDLHVNGHQNLSENIADLAGLNAAYDAWRASLHGKPAPVLGGLTGEQRFFLAYAQSWREIRREAMIRRMVLTDGHSPERYRASTVRNIDAWYKAFDVKPGQALYLKPEDRVKVW